MIANGQAHQAAAHLRALLADGRGGALARVTLVRALIEAGEVEAAIAEAREAVSLNPGLPSVLVALAKALLASENLPAAIGELQRALRLDPGHDEARFLTGRAWAEAGEAEKALAIFDQLDAATPGLGEWRARLEAMRGAERSDPGYVRHLFDQFSTDYDRRMRTELSYAAPEILSDLAGLVMPARTSLNVLDLGCGTGLAGAVFRSRAARLDGIDLSPAMIEQAKAKSIYDHLTVGDIEAGLASVRYDLVIAADTLVYLGDLKPVARAVRACLAGDGYFLFTVEAGDGDSFALGSKRRWRHSEAYLRGLAAQTGFSVAGLVAASPRQEKGQPVEGFAVAFAAD
jgi:predicted TPR repeat methyltransferase